MKNAYKYLIAILFTLSLFLVWNNLNSKKENIFSSRTKMEAAMEYVKKAKPTPPQQAIFYAKVAEAIKNKTLKDVSEETFKSILDGIKSEETALPNVVLKQGTENNEYWVGQNPFSPKIGQYPRFLLKDFVYAPPEPPKYKSPEFYTALKQVHDAAANRTQEQAALVNFYGGVPGTEGPSGIWQNILWSKAKSDKSLTDEKYADVQLVLARSLADSFMECWKNKYIWQTKRPDMTDKEINLAMPNPPFPSYVSGHSTISFTAANILSYIFPGDKDFYLDHAAKARDSRLHAGIHFPYDNSEGQKLGEEIAKNIIANLK